ncbi:S-layer homology domain-containing protein [Anaerovorax sp. IOR16]|uniref:S-layer homology domain-containing protein n=1 Tax=Anaerovorax sp. IOR16 TaxID=2773458 RepID=UPI0019D18D47|nr:S-layer homology domain-containing protein [Anaerovorax sp. IOR16]
MLVSILKRMGSGLLAAALVCSLTIPNIEVYGASMRDIKGHWAERYINQIISAGIVKGYENGTFLPDNPVTRAEFSHMINAALGNTGTTSVSFNDTPKSEWYYTDISKALSAGYVAGYSDGSFKPNNPVSRQEAAVMLSRIVPTYGKNSDIKHFKDHASVENWAVESMQRMNGKGYIGAYDDGKLHPTDKLTRAQTAKIISDILNKESIVKNDPNVSSNGMSLTNKIYSNGVTMSRSLGDGNAYIENCVVLGKLSVQGGGENSINISNSRVVNADVAKSSDSVRVYLKGETNVEHINVSNNAILQTSSLYGGNFGPGFKKINVQRSAKVTFTGNFPEVNLDGSNAEVTFTSGTVNNLNVASNASSTDVTVETNASIIDSNINASCGFHGNGNIRNMRVNANGVTYSKRPTNVYIHSKVNVRPNEEDENSEITMSPSNRSTNVSTRTDITLTFKNAMTLYNGRSISSSNIDDFVELREGSANGSKISFNASINSSKRVITIEPDSRLDDDERYYVIIDRRELKDSRGNANDAFSEYFSTGDDDQDGDIVMDPAPRETNVSTRSDITLTFKDSMTLYNGHTITSSNIDDFVELREGSTNGSKISFDASINSSKKVITIEPDSRLDDDKRYYVIIGRRELKDSRGNANDAFSEYFSTGDDDQDGDITMYPSPKKSNVSRNTDITLTFKDSMTLYNGRTITSSNIDDFVELREGSTSGSKVRFSASINSSKKVITIDPSSRLDDDERYYVIIDRRELKDSRNNGNNAFSAYFSTGDDDDTYATYSPRNGETNVSTTVKPTIRFSERVIKYSGSSTIRSSDLKNIIDFRVNNSSGNRVSFDASISSERNITITPRSPLSENTKYYLAINSNTLKTSADRTKIPSSYVTFTTKGVVRPQVTSLTTTSTENTITVNVTGNYSGTAYVMLVGASDATPTANQIISNNGTSTGKSVSVSANSAKSLVFSGLSPSSTYKIVAFLRSSSIGDSSISTKTVTTKAPSIPSAKLSSLSVDGRESFSPAFNSNTDTYDVVMPFGSTTATVNATNSNGYAKINSDAANSSVSSNVDLSPGQTTTVTIVASGDAQTNSTYRLNITVAGNTGVSNLTVNGSSISVSGSTFTADLGSGTSTSADIDIIADDPNARIRLTGTNTGSYSLRLDDIKESQELTFTITSNGKSKEYTLRLQFTAVQPPEPTPEPTPEP